MMYRNEEDFVRGQKIKLAVAANIMIVVLIHSWATTGTLTGTWFRDFNGQRTTDK